MSIANSVASLEADEAKIVAMVAEQADGAEISSITDDGMDSSSPAAGPWSQIRLALGAIWLGGVALLCLPVVLGTVRLGRRRKLLIS